MRSCINCKTNNKDTDIYCRNCGVIMKSNSYYVMINIFTIFAFIFLLIVIGLFIALYFVF